MMEQLEDNLYLKQYVRNHPDNKMAWYLLGKQYLQLDKTAKANYCFIQAGEIYEAFERKPHPLAESPQEMLEDWNRQQRKKRRIRRAIMGAISIALLLMVMPSNASKLADPAAAGMAAVIDAPIDPTFGVVLTDKGERNPIGSAWEELLSWTKRPSVAAVVKLEEQEGWRKWTGSRKLLMSVEQQSDYVPMEVKMLDGGVCSCKPADASTVKTKFKAWSEQQEVRWTLASAIYQYKRMQEKWPEKLDDLIKPYPNNVLAGEASGMKEMFKPLVAAMKTDQSGAKQPAQQQNEAEGDKPKTDSGQRQSQFMQSNSDELVGGVDQTWRKPLEIVVDKSTYRLAVVSGDIIVRSFKVGLGGDKTPEGSFYISEKVKNPNGRDNGQFGSRGMTLSSTLYAIHGTDEPDSLEQDESLGCIRMGKQDVEELFDLVPMGTIVKIKNGTLPSEISESKERFKLNPSQDETNPGKVYHWLG